MSISTYTYIKFKYEGLDVAAQLLEDCSWMTTFDLKSGYHHIDIHPVYQQYLGFSWKKDGERCYYVFKVLHLGLPRPAMFSPRC